jgi:hypothetical protein
MYLWLSTKTEQKRCLIRPLTPKNQILFGHWQLIGNWSEGDFLRAKPFLIFLHLKEAKSI